MALRKKSDRISNDSGSHTPGGKGDPDSGASLGQLPTKSMSIACLRFQTRNAKADGSQVVDEAMKIENQIQADSVLHSGIF